MDLLPRNTALGELALVEVYAYVDIPCLFACRNRSGQHFLAVWIEETADANRWVYVPVSEQRLRFVRSGGIELRDAFTAAEEESAYVVSVPRGQGETTLERVACRSLTDAMLPSAGERLDLDTPTLPAAEDEELVRAADEARREVVRLKLNFPECRRSEAPAKEFADIIACFQALMDAIGHAVKGDATTSGRIPSDVLRQTRMAVTGTGGGSFSVIFAATAANNVLNESLAQDAIAEFIRLAEAGSDLDGLRQAFSRLKGRSATRYRLLLERLAGAESGLDVLWASPRSRMGHTVQMDNRRVVETVKAVSAIDEELAEPYEVVGTLYAINLHSMYFGLEGLREGEGVTGTVLPEALSEVPHPSAGEQYRATVREKREINSLTGEERVRHLLVGLRPLKK